MDYKQMRKRDHENGCRLFLAEVEVTLKTSGWCILKGRPGEDSEETFDRYELHGAFEVDTTAMSFGDDDPDDFEFLRQPLEITPEEADEFDMSWHEFVDKKYPKKG